MQTEVIFERTFVISLAFRADRLNAFYKQTRQIGMPDPELWPAIHGDVCKHPDIWTAGNGAWGCYRSHMNILEYCLNNKVASYLVLEDDAQFRDNYQASLYRFKEQLPDDWEQVYLGGQLMHVNAQPPIKISDHVYRPFNVNRTHAFAIARAGMSPAYQHLTNLPYHAKEHIDHHLGRWHEDPSTKVYCPDKWLVGQMGASSNVSGNVEPITFFDDPSSFALQHTLYDKPVCVLYRGPRAPLLQSAANYLHCGNQIDSNGYDITLTLAAKLADPIPAIAKWYNWIRSEIARCNPRALPCLYHPRITKEQLQQVCPTVIEINSLINLKEQIDAIYLLGGNKDSLHQPMP